MQLPKITNKQQEILLFLYRFRFLNRVQIQKLLNHKSHVKINTWLKDLTDKQYTGRIYERKVGINDPAIYYISTAGIKFLGSAQRAEKARLTKLYQESRRSEGFIKQCILIADLYLQLKEQNHTGFKFYTSTDFPTNGVIQALAPNFAYVKETNGNVEHYSCEVIKTGMPRFAIRSRVSQFIDFFSKLENQQVFIIFYCDNDKLANYITKYAAKLLEEEEIDHINFTGLVT